MRRSPREPSRREAHASLLRASIPALILLVVAAPVLAQEQPAPQPDLSPPSTPAPAPTPPEEDPLPSLDELLGLPESGQGPLDDPSKTDLDRVLNGGEIGNAFRQAVTMMDDVARRMSAARDASLTTQRMQEVIIRRLDQLISSLEQQQQQQQQSSSQQQQQQQQSQSSQRVPKQQQSQENQEQQGDNTGQTTLPDRRDGALSPALDAARASWGNLPERVREMLVQGTSDRFSNIYKDLTESYYKKLAEEAKQR
jgi:hypothetical protein